MVEEHGWQALLGCPSEKLLDPATGVIHYSHHVAFDESDFSHPALRKDLDFSLALVEEPVIMSSDDNFDPASLQPPTAQIYPESLLDLRSPGMTDMPMPSCPRRSSPGQYYTHSGNG